VPFFDSQGPPRVPIDMKIGRNITFTRTNHYAAEFGSNLIKNSKSLF
jgi:hypothetical protein